MLSNQKQDFQTYKGACDIKVSELGITQIIIHSSEPSKDFHFLKNTLQYQQITLDQSRSINGLNNSMTFRAPNGFTIHLGTLASNLLQYSAGHIISITIQDFNKLKVKLEAIGITLWYERVDADEGKKQAFFLAPDGTLFHMTCFDETDKKRPKEFLKSKSSLSNEISFTAEDLFKGLGHCGIEWILIPTHSFEVMIEFLTQIFGYHMVTQGVPKNEQNYSRYALFSTPSGVTLELLEIDKDNPGRFKAPLISFTVNDLPSSIELLEQEKLKRLSEMIGAQHWAWTYFRTQKGSFFQLQGPR